MNTCCSTCDVVFLLNPFEMLEKDIIATNKAAEKKEHEWHEDLKRAKEDKFRPEALLDILRINYVQLKTILAMHLSFSQNFFLINNQKSKVSETY